MNLTIKKTEPEKKRECAIGATCIATPHNAAVYNCTAVQIKASEAHAHGPHTARHRLATTTTTTTIIENKYRNIAYNFTLCERAFFSRAKVVLFASTGPCFFLLWLAAFFPGVRLVSSPLARFSCACSKREPFSYVMPWLLLLLCIIVDVIDCGFWIMARFFFVFAVCCLWVISSGGGLSFPLIFLQPDVTRQDDLRRASWLWLPNIPNPGWGQF